MKKGRFQRKSNYTHLGKVLTEIVKEECSHQRHLPLSRMSNLLSRYGAGLEERIPVGNSRGGRLYPGYGNFGYYPRKGVLIGITSDGHYIYFMPGTETHLDREDKKETIFLAVQRRESHYPRGGFLSSARTEIRFSKPRKISAEEVALNLSIAGQLRVISDYLNLPESKRQEEDLSLSSYIENPQAR